MNLENMPEGATHWDEEDESWMKLSYGKWYFFSENLEEWFRYFPSEEELDSYKLIQQADITVKYQGEKPTQGSELAAGYDVRASEDVVITPSSIGEVITTTKMQMPDDIACLLLPRSSICDKNGLMLINSAGLIDPDYTGSLIFKFWNLSAEPVTIEKGERIGQATFHKRLTVEFVEEEFAETERGEQGFGSSGVK